MLIESLLLGAMGGVVGFTGKQIYNKIKPVKKVEIQMTLLEV